MSERGSHDPILAPGGFSVEDRIEDVGRFARGVKTNPRGRRRAGIALAWLAAVLVLGVLAVLLLA